MTFTMKSKLLPPISSISLEEHFEVVLIEQSPALSTKDEIDRLRLERETFWTLTLQTKMPFGINIKSDFSSHGQLSDDEINNVMSLPRITSGRVQRRQRIVSEDRARRPSTRSVSVPATVVLDDSQAINSGCIDLTNDDSVNEPSTGRNVIDLTSVNDSPVVLLSPVDEDSPRRRRRRRCAARSSNYNPEDVGPTSSRTRMQRMLDTDDDDSLPPFSVTGTPYSPEGSTSNVLTAASPTVERIYCPVCLDDAKQIQRSGRQVFSTVCGHIFCNQCISQAITAQRCCPMCRRKLNSNKIHVLHL